MMGLLLLFRALLRGDGLDTGDVAAGFAQPRGVLKLPGGALEAPIEALLLQIENGVGHLIGAHCADIGAFHLGHDPHSAMRATKRVLIGSLAAASDSASFAVCTVTPSISKMTRPGFTRATHSSGVPLPEPIRTSAGFFDTGTSGKMRIQTRPARFMWRVTARRGGHAPGALHVAGQRAAGGLDLARGDALGRHRLQPELAERQGRAGSRGAVDAALMRLAKLRLLWLHHGLRPQTFCLFAHDLIRKPVPTFRGHAVDHAASRRGREPSPSAIFLSCA